MVRRANSIDDPVERELSEIKRLLVLFLIRDGASQAVVASALGVAQSSVSRMFPGGIGMAKSAKTSKR